MLPENELESQPLQPQALAFFHSPSQGLMSVPVENTKPFLSLVPDARQIPSPEKGEVLVRLGTGEPATLPLTNLSALQSLDEGMTPIAYGQKNGVLLAQKAQTKETEVPAGYSPVNPTVQVLTHDPSAPVNRNKIDVSLHKTGPHGEQTDVLPVEGNQPAPIHVTTDITPRPPAAGRFGAPALPAEALETPELTPTLASTSEASTAQPAAQPLPQSDLMSQEARRASLAVAPEIEPINKAYFEFANLPITLGPRFDIRQTVPEIMGRLKSILQDKDFDLSAPPKPAAAPIVSGTQQSQRQPSPTPRATWASLPDAMLPKADKLQTLSEISRQGDVHPMHPALKPDTIAMADPSRSEVKEVPVEAVPELQRRGAVVAKAIKTEDGDANWAMYIPVALAQQAQQEAQGERMRSQRKKSETTAEKLARLDRELADVKRGRFKFGLPAETDETN